MTTRRQFLRGRFAPRHQPLRPPWALAEEAFLAACTRCGDCVAACTPGALRRTDDGQPPWRLLPVIAASCLAQQGVVCRTCGDVCAAAAIRFRPQLGGSALPDIDPSRCTGCGACVAPCPARAIAMTSVGG